MSVFCVIDQKMTLEDVTRKVHLAAPLAYDNSNAHSMRVTVFNQDGTEADLTGISAVGSFMRLTDTGGTVTPINGTVTGNVAEVILPGSCYVVPGRFRFTLNLSELTPTTGIDDFSTSESYSKGDLVVYNGAVWRFTSAHSAGAWTGTDAVLDGNMRTALWVEGLVERNISGTIIDPGTPVGNIEQAIGAATAAATTATAAASTANTAAQAANDAAAAAATAMAGAVRFDQAQTLTNPEQRQARQNISATHTGVVDAWYARNGQHPATAKEFVTGTVAQNNNVSYEANGLCIKLNGTSQYGFIVSLLGTRPYVQNNSTTPSGTPLGEFAVTPGHLYRLRLKLVGGSVTTSQSDPIFIVLTDTTGSYISGTRCFVGNETYITFSSNQTPIGQMCFFSKKNVTFDNAVYTMEFVDVTSLTDTNDTSIAPHTGLAASQAFTSGSLMMYGGQLYKATAAIASGDTITPGSSGNVTATSIAALFTPTVGAPTYTNNSYIESVNFASSYYYKYPIGIAIISLRFAVTVALTSTNVKFGELGFSIPVETRVSLANQSGVGSCLVTIGTDGSLYACAQGDSKPSGWGIYNFCITLPTT